MCTITRDDVRSEAEVGPREARGLAPSADVGRRRSQMRTSTGAASVSPYPLCLKYAGPDRKWVGAWDAEDAWIREW